MGAGQETLIINNRIMRTYYVYYNEAKYLIVEAKNKEKAEEIVRLGEFDDSDTGSEGINLSSVRAEPRIWQK